MATTYAALTPDGEVATVEMVQVAVTEPREETQVVTLAFLDTQLGVVAAEIDRLVAEKARLTDLRKAVLAEAETVELKPEPEPVEEEPAVVVPPVT